MTVRTTLDSLPACLMQWRSRELTAWQFLLFLSSKQSNPLSYPPREGSRRLLLSVLRQISRIRALYVYSPLSYFYQEKKKNTEVYHNIVSLTEPCELTYVFFYLFNFGCAGSSLLSGLSLVVARRLLLVVASLVAEHRL